MKYQRKNTGGFSIIELLIVIAITILIITIVIISHSRFRGSVLVTNAAYDTALSIRQAQSYGISSRQFGTGQFEYAYGIHFNASSKSSFVLFADVNGNGKYDGSVGSSCSGSSECVKVFSLIGDNTLSVCGVDVIASLPTRINECDISYLDIMFKRPEPDACIRSNRSSDLPGSGVTCPLNSRYRQATVEVSSTQGMKKTVEIFVTGQISVK
ncbi:MAG: hypothetical protein Q8P86_04050 [bacterium]|nr:hypothetical protein [bacterium]